ncbi:polysaccharide pyruvyl transferase family protein [Oceanirhabdus seepicola]|uniref:Polysaccharide pyruvyl transferase family protein n=1 Tax=Oceanirhabdus seepicola TaxID=2828781 RepID=A0A9J6NZL4_9CLOT|nr:polysaccharide pyruvyl transferase family protein [Oceanirhabdus seepicola]MCM1989313.1 polysaccharide pyruvyl transferase family protein [Oceanirhabdus seepicola]
MNSKKILYLGWIGRHNIGDDLLLDIFKKILLNLNSKTIIKQYDPTRGTNINLRPYDLILLGGGSLLRNSTFVNVCLKANKMNIPTIIWGSGTDIRNKTHAEKIIYYYNISKNNPSLSKNRMIERNIINTVRNSSLTGVRGNITKFLLNSNNVKIIGDPGIIFSKVFNKLPLNDEVKKLNLSKENTVLVNWGTSYNSILGNNEKTVEEKLTIAVNKLLDQGYKVVIYPIWNVDLQVCKNFAKKLNHKNLLCINKLYNVYNLARMIQSCKFTINLKLHANILSMSYGKPFICLGYGLKCYDFVESINSKDLYIPTDKVTGHKILEKVNYINKNYNNIQDRFNKSIDKYYKLQLDYIEEINKFLKNM